MSDSVRANQGGTEEDIGLIVTDRDRNLVNNDQLFRVAISRHKRTLNIFVEPGTEMDVLMRAKLRVDDERFPTEVGGLCKPDLEPYLSQDLADGPGARGLLHSLGIIREELEVTQPLDLEWCSADVIGHYDGPEVAALFKLFVTQEKEAYVDDKLVKLQAIVDYVETLDDDGLWILDAETYKSVLVTGKGRRRIVLTHEHVRVPTSEEVKLFEPTTVTVRDSKRTKTFSGARCLIPMLVESDGFDVSHVPWRLFLSRCKKSARLNITPVKSVGRWKYEDSLMAVQTPEVSVSQKAVMEALGVIHPMETYAPVDSFVQPEEILSRPTQPTSDAYLFSDSFSPAFRIDAPMLNHVEATLGFTNVPRNGELSADWLNKVNARGHPVDIHSRCIKGLAMSIGEGLRYFGDNQFQSLHAVGQRYLRRRKVFRYNEQAKKTAEKIADTFVKERQDPVVIDAHKEADIVREWELVSLQRKYEKRRQGESEFDGMTIRYHLKDIFKPTKDLPFSGGNPFLESSINLLKAGQGISAWSAEANIKFGAITRIINHRWLSSLKSDTTYNNKFSEKEIDDQLQEKRRSILPGAKTLVTDGGEFDAMQNRFTQRIEQRHSEHLGIPKIVIDAYYQYRNDYKIMEHGLFKAKARSEKTSGEPGTLLYNSQLGGSICNIVGRGIGPSTMELQGDDAKKTQVGIREDKEALGEISRYSDFKLKASIGTNQEFCGNVEIDGTLVPSVHRLFKKISAQTFRSPTHFYEYKMAVLDKIARIERVGANVTVAASAAAANTSFDEMDSLYDCVKSFSHISWEQFVPMAVVVKAPVGTPALIM
jgi:hypothetical protein